MPVELSADEMSLLQFVDAPTLMRGRDYVATGAVRGSRWLAGDQQVYGEVMGNALAPYTAWVRLSRSADGVLTSFQGTCTCPVGHNCKHSVALFLAAGRASAGDSSAETPGREASPSSWERPLRALLREPERAISSREVALQFEVVQPTRSYRTGLAAPLRIGMRPVSRGRRGGWIRSEISWQTLAAPWDGAEAQERMRLLQEVYAMDAGSRTTYYSNPNPLIYLDGLSNKRIWDVLADAKAVGLPLVQAESGTPVRLLDEPARVVIELSRDGDDLVLTPRITAGGEEPARAERLLLGPVAHGVAWWAAEGLNDPTTDGELRLAPLAEAVDPTVRALLDNHAITVPAAEERRFFTEYFPVLHERTTIVADPRVTIPEPEPPVLGLRLEYADDERLELAWQWRYVLGDAVRTEPLWLTATSRRRDAEAETVIVKAIEEVLGELPGVVAAVADGGRLMASSTLGGIEAMRFVSDVLPRLAEIDDLEIETVGTPRTYREATASPIVEMHASVPAGDRDWLDLAVTITVDGEDVPFDRLFVALASGDRHLVLPSGTWFSLERPELATLAALIAEARALNDRGPQTARVGRFQADLWEELDRLGVISGQAAQWQASMRALSRVEQVAETAVPDSITATLRPYQAAGFSWLAFLHEYGLGGVLADEMGLGKTLQAIALMAHTREGGERRPFLVVAPTSVVYNWLSECERFAPTLDVRIVTETGKRRPMPISEIAAGVDVVVTSYALFRLEYDDYAAIGWAGLILDEAQFVKNPKSRAYRCAKLLPAPFKLAITGTPMENNLTELWSLLSITAPGLFPNPAGFEKHYRTPIEKDDDRDRLAQLRRRVKPLMLRRTKEQVVDDLPAKQEQVVELPLNAKHRRVYDTHLHRERQKVLGLLGNLEKNRFEIFRSLTLLRQASLDPVLVDPRYAGVPSTKLDALMELLTEITSEGHRTLVFSQFTRFLGNAKQRLDEAGMTYCYLDGSTRQRPAVIERFRTGDVPVFLISLKAGGFGLNLTEADYCVLLDPWWNPATEAQAVDRIHRIGQTRNVMVYRLVAKDTIEDKVMALKARKAALFSSVMSDGEVAPGALTAADIRGILE